MFPVLKRKIRLYLIDITTAIIAVMFLLLFCLYHHFITNDFSKRTEQFQGQICENLSSKFLQIEETVDIYIQRNKLPYIMENGGAESISRNSLYTVNNYCMEIPIVFISSQDFGSCFPNSYTEQSFKDFLGEFDIANRSKASRSVWSYAENRKIKSEDMGDYWLCTKPIDAPDGKRLGYVTAIINISLNQFFSKSNNSFWKDNTYYLVTDKYTAPIYTRSMRGTLNYKEDMNAAVPEKVILSAAASGKTETRHGTHIYSSPLAVGNFRLVTCSKSKYTSALMRRIGIILGGIFIVITALCIFVAARITGILINDLNSLCTRVENYIDEQEQASAAKSQNGRVH